MNELEAKLSEIRERVEADLEIIPKLIQPERSWIRDVNDRAALLRVIKIYREAYACATRSQWVDSLKRPDYAKRFIEETDAEAARALEEK